MTEPLPPAGYEIVRDPSLIIGEFWKVAGVGSSEWHYTGEEGATVGSMTTRWPSLRYARPVEKPAQELRELGLHERSLRGDEWITDVLTAWVVHDYDGFSAAEYRKAGIGGIRFRRRVTAPGAAATPEAPPRVTAPAPLMDAAHDRQIVARMGQPAGPGLVSDNLTLACDRGCGPLATRYEYRSCPYCLSGRGVYRLGR